jgi:hypothetical protein
LAIAALLSGLSLSLSPMRVARAATVTVTAGPDVDAANNDYRRIQNALNTAMSGDTIMLSGTFDFTQPFAAAAWALGNDNTAGTGDDYEVLVPSGLSNVTLTASSLGAATIQGPGDLAAINLEAFLVFDSSLSGASQNWTISNLQIQDFDLSIGMFAVAASDYDNTKIMNNYTRVPKDLDSAVAPVDVTQNIGIHFSFGANQTISGNTIELDGSAVRTNDAADVGMQSNTKSGAYDGLQITNNIIKVLNAQSAGPEVILGIWENGHSHTSNITVSGNQFINLAGANNPATNLQRAFRVTSHSSATSTVKYQNNSESGANIGFQWISGADFTGLQPVQLISNNILNNATGVLIQSNGSATLSFNRIVGNTVFGLNNSTGNAINAENNWWGCNFGPGVGGAGCAGTANGVQCTTTDSPTTGGSNEPNVNVTCLVDFNPWLVLRLTASPGTVIVGGMSTLTADLTFNSDNVDTHLSGNIPDLTPVAFAGNAFGTVNPMNTSTASGKATSTYTGTAPGTDNVSTTVDMQTVKTPITVNPAPCVLTCPANKSQSNDQDQCGAVVTYNAPTTVGTCGTVVCSPASGSFFPVGTTTVTCKSNNNAGPEMCTFTVTVNDTQSPLITCPGSVNTTAAASCPIATGAPGNFTVTASDNCPGVTVVCTPPSGSTFPVGTTSVSCTATDASGNKATCTFSVSAFSFCLQDDSNPGNVVLVNAVTGDFSFCCGGVPIASGRGTLTTHGCIGSIDASKGDRQVHIQWDTAARNGLGEGTAYVQKLSNKTICQITDKNMSNNTCQCSNPPPMSSPNKPPKERSL